LICPVCGDDLHAAAGTLKCPQSHSFDIAKEGYVNLLLSGRRRAKILGDAQAMIRARRRFLEQGFYEPLSDALNQRVHHYLETAAGAAPAPAPLCVADMGCGEGYYVGRLKQALDRRLATTACRYFGMDISKQAARLAAKAYPDICFFVANTNDQILFATGSVHILLNIFAPRNPAEFARVLVPGGLLLVALPNPDHLADLPAELKLLGIEEDKQQHVLDHFAGAFTLAGQHTISHKLVLDSSQLVDLVRMTPNYWHLEAGEWSKIEALAGTTASASFTILEFRRDQAAGAGPTMNTP
jgi:23S rRNA (guanine745-N1)-methyltransferase